jgi:hypothetical protein
MSTSQSAKPSRVEIAPFDAREGVVTLATLALTLFFMGVLALVAGTPMVPGVTAGVLFTVGGVCAVGGLVVQALRSR